MVSRGLSGRCGHQLQRLLPAAPPKAPLYKRLGGREGIAVVVADFVAIMAADPRVNARFTTLKPPEVEKFKSNLSDQICDATGGPCSYLGKDMKAAHKGMQITEAEWSATVENLGKALDKNKVGVDEQKELRRGAGADEAGHRRAVNRDRIRAAATARRRVAPVSPG